MLTAVTGINWGETMLVTPGICLMSLRVTGSLPSPYQRQPIFIGIGKSSCFIFSALHFPRSRVPRSCTYILVYQLHFFNGRFAGFLYLFLYTLDKKNKNPSDITRPTDFYTIQNAGFSVSASAGWTEPAHP